MMIVSSDSEEKISMCVGKRTVRDDVAVLTHARMTDAAAMIAETAGNKVQPAKPKGCASNVNA